MGNTTKRDASIAGDLPKADLKRGMGGLIQTLEAFDELAKRMGRSIMHPWVGAVVTRHWNQCHRINDMKKYVSFYLRGRYGSAGASATWYKNKHSKSYKTFQNTATDIKHFAEPITPNANGGLDVHMARFKQAGPDEYAEIIITEEEMRSVRRVQKHLSTIRGSILAIRAIMEKSEFLKEIDELDAFDFTSIMAVMPPPEKKSSDIKQEGAE